MRFRKSVQRALRLPQGLRALVALAAAAVVLATVVRPVVRPAGATTYLDSSYGSPRTGATARSLAMGGTGISSFQGVDALVLNPAGLAAAPAGGMVSLSAGLTQANEDRFVPLFDSFESFVDETAIALNRNTYSFAEGGVLYRLPSEAPMTLGFGWFERFDYDYDYFEELRDPDPFSDIRDRILEDRRLEVDGRLRSVSVGYGAEVAPHVRVGLAGHRYFGDVRRTRQVVQVLDPSLGSTVQRVERDLGGWGWSVGAHGDVDDRLEVGASFEGPFTVDGDLTQVDVLRVPGTPDAVTEVGGRHEIYYPGTLRFGATYRPRNVLRTTFSVEAVRRFWTDLRDRTEQGASSTETDGKELGLRDTWDLRMGLEHVFYNGLPVRFGFRYIQNYADRQSERSIYSVGIGHPVGLFRVDVTGQYHRQTTRQPFLFDPSVTTDNGTFPAPQSDAKVEDSVLRLVVGVSRSF